MILKGKDLPEENGRKPYPLSSHDVVGKHFVVRVTGPDNPFEPHRHAQREIWFIVEGQAVVSLDETDHVVEGGDLVELEPWVEHGLRTKDSVTWICMG